MSGLVALTPGHEVSDYAWLPPGFFGTRFVMTLVETEGTLRYTAGVEGTLHAFDHIGPAIADPLFRFFTSSTGPTYSKRLDFDGDSADTFDSSYPFCDIYVKQVLRATFTRAATAGSRPAWSLFNVNAEMGLVAGEKTVILAHYRAS
jgi:hypothetical protein